MIISTNKDIAYVNKETYNIENMYDFNSSIEIYDFFDDKFIIKSTIENQQDIMIM